MIHAMPDTHTTADGAGRVRLIIDTTEALRKAVRLRAVKEGVSISELVNSLIHESLQVEIAEVEKLSARKKKP